MNYLYSFRLLLLLVCYSGISLAQITKDNKKLELYVLMGQSNMAGRGEINGDLKILSHPGVYMLDSLGAWQPAKNPIHFDKPKIVGVGPGLSFGIAMAEIDTNVIIGLVPCAVGGTAIEKWKAGAYDKASRTYPFDEAVARIKKAMQYGVVKGMIWHQGEANSSTTDSLGYIKKLNDLIEQVRFLTGNFQLPVVIGELGRFKERYQHFNEILAKVPSEIPFTALATSETLTDKGDGTHFDGNSANEYGKRYAAKMLEVQREFSKK